MVPALAALLAVSRVLLPAQTGDPGAQPGAVPPTFAGGIAGLVHEHCAPCHRPGQSAPFPLLGYRDVAKRRRQILKVVERRYMPPWLPSPGLREFEGERRLTEAEIDTLRRWVAAGAPAGDAAQMPAPPEWAAGWYLGEPDLVLELAEPFELPADGEDVFRNFVIPVPERGHTRYVTGFELRPGNPRVVHHAIVQVDDTGSCRELDRDDPGPGFGGMTMGESEPPDGHFLGWTPGKVPRETPADMAWRLVPGADLVLQVHLTPSGKTERVQPRIGLRFTDRAPTRSPYTIVLFSETIDLAAGGADQVITDDYVTPTAIDVLGVYPHAHYLARQMSGRAILPDGRVEWLFRIDDWDFNWQDEYRYRTPLRLPAGTRLVMEYHFDNSADNPRNPNQPPARVTFGPRSVDEMATLSLQVLPVDPAARPALEQARWRHTLAKKPWDWHARNELACLLLQADRVDEAVGELQQLLTRRPETPPALCNLALAMRMVGRPADAEKLCRAALELEPDSAAAEHGLGMALALQDRLEPALPHLRRALELRPTFAEGEVDLANVLAFRGEPAAAREHYQSALRIQPDLPEAHNNLGNTWLAEQHFAEAAAAYRHALELRPTYFNARLNLGRALLALGEIDAARTELRAALALRPADPAAQHLLEQAR